MKKTINFKLPEWREQAFVIKWLKLAYPDALFTASCAGVKLSIEVAIKLKAMGYSAGTPDLMIFANRPTKDTSFAFALFIEMKRKKGGIVSPEQKYWGDRLNAEGYKWVVCYGADEAIAVIKEYLG